MDERPLRRNHAPCQGGLANATASDHGWFTSPPEGCGLNREVLIRTAINTYFPQN